MILDTEKIKEKDCRGDLQMIVEALIDIDRCIVKGTIFLFKAWQIAYNTINPVTTLSLA